MLLQHDVTHMIALNVIDPYSEKINANNKLALSVVFKASFTKPLKYTK